MNQEFLRPRLRGRFEEHSLPLEIFKDIAVLEEMLVEVAKREYLAAHPQRVRSPKGFGTGLELHLTAVEEGSAIPVIAFDKKVIEKKAKVQRAHEEARGWLYSGVAT